MAVLVLYFMGGVALISLNWETAREHGASRRAAIAWVILGLLIFWLATQVTSLVVLTTAAILASAVEPATGVVGALLWLTYLSLCCGGASSYLAVGWLVRRRTQKPA